MLDSVKTLEQLKTNLESNEPKCWDRLKDATTHMDTSQISWVMSNEGVKEAYNKLSEAFNMYLFEKFKDDFSTVPAFKDICNSYIDTVLMSAQGFAQHTKDLEAENQRLKKQLEEVLNAK